MKPNTFVFLQLLLALVCSLGTIGLAQDTTGTDEANSTSSPSNDFLTEDGFVTEKAILDIEKPLSGVVTRNDASDFFIRLVVNGTDYPNVLVTLTVENDDGDADVFCLPYLNPGVAFQNWHSRHSEGRDFVFISRRDPIYDLAKLNYTIEENTVLEGIWVSCHVVGHAAFSEFLLELDVDYSPRSLIKQEQNVMKKIYKKCCLDDDELCPNWRNFKTESGKVHMDFCHMPGSICDEDRRILRLNLRNEGLGCEFPIEEVSQLKHLEKLQFEDNPGLTGDIGPILQSVSTELPALEYLDIARSGLSGQLDEDALCQLTGDGKLAYLNLAWNSIGGSLPDCLFTEDSSMKELIIGGNNIMGPIPPMSENAKLQEFHIGSCALSGELDASVGRAKGLRVLDVSNNDIGGVIPGSLAASTTLEIVLLSENNFVGFEDEWIEGRMNESNLLVLNVSSNNIQGPFPQALAQAPLLYLVDMSSNEMTGALPDERDMFQRVVSFSVRDNNFNGKIPITLAGLSVFSREVVFQLMVGNRLGLMAMDLSGNQLTGRIPDFLVERSVPPEAHFAVSIGGNNLDVPCPVPEDFEYILDLKCTGDEKGLPTTGTSNSGKLGNQLAGLSSDIKEDGGGEEERGKSRSNAAFAIIGVAVALLVVVVAVLAVLYRMRKKRSVIVTQVLREDVEMGAGNVGYVRQGDNTGNSSGPV